MIKDRDKVTAALEKKFCKGCDHFIEEGDDLDGLSECDGEFDTETDCVIYNIFSCMADWDWEDEEEENESA